MSRTLLSNGATVVTLGSSERVLTQAATLRAEWGEDRVHPYRAPTFTTFPRWKKFSRAWETSTRSST